MAITYEILLDPSLGITATQLAAAWVNDAACAQAGQCAAGGNRRSDFAVDIGDASTIALITMAATLSKDLLVELVKQAVARARQRQSEKEDSQIVVEQIPDPKTGLPILRVHQRGEAKI